VLQFGGDFREDTMKIRELVESEVCITCGTTEGITGCWCDPCWAELTERILTKYNGKEMGNVKKP